MFTQPARTSPPQRQTTTSCPIIVAPSGLSSDNSRAIHTTCHSRSSTLSIPVAPAGPAQRNPAELLASELAQQLLATLREQYRTIIIDTSPIIPFTDADVIGALSDGIIVVGRVGKTERSMFTRALASVSSTRILGTVLNGTDFSLADWNRPSDYYYTQHYGKDPEK